LSGQRSDCGCEKTLYAMHWQITVLVYKFSPHLITLSRPFVEMTFRE